MSRRETRSARGASLAGALLLAVSAPAQEISLAPVGLPASAAMLPDPASGGAGPLAGEPADAAPPAGDDGIEEVVVQGSSSVFLREQLELAEDELYALYNDVNTIEEFDIQCRLHARTGTRVPQRRCLPNFAARLDERKGQAVLRNLSGSSAYDLDWLQPEAEMTQKSLQLQTHMQRLALEHPELLEAMRALYGLMQGVEAEAWAGAGDP